MVLAPVAAGRERALRELLDTMNSEPGVADPGNAVLPFGEFDRLHFARLVLLVDPNLGDIEAYGLPRPSLLTYLALMGDCDGPSREFLADLSRRASAGLRRIFACCEGFDDRDNLLAWMLAHDLPVAANYVNWVGRTVRQVRQESALQRALAAKVSREPVSSGKQAQQRRRDLIAYVQDELRAGRLVLTAPDPTPLGWQVANLVHAIVVPLAGLVALPFLPVLAPLLIVLLRRHEISDPEICPPPDPAALLELQRLEDRDVTNQYSALGLVKPGLFRRWLLTVLLLLVDYACRHISTRGNLARIQTIHFARWVFLDGKTRLAFASHYDGGHEAYMDDFINKVGWGLNLLFSNGVGWPHTDWLLLRGARQEHLFKYYQRRHQLPTQVWYKAYPSLALVDLKRNQRIREGLELAQVTDAQASAWLKLL
jgi:hypothetical protein